MMARVDFRDGPREVPEHLAELMEPLDTYKLTYDEAVKAANDKLLADHLDKTLSKMVSQHFNDWKNS
jgi:hypothetical protein